jgi:hypothetical protein
MHTCAKRKTEQVAEAEQLIYVNFNEVRSHDDTHLKCWVVIALFGEENTLHLLEAVLVFV